jgi:parallel beta-helix repeat protein
MERTLRILGVLVVLLAGLLWTGATPVRGTGFVVNANFDDADAHDASPGDCLCADTYSRCTLRAAVEEANQCAGADTITFQGAMNIYVTQGSFQLYETVVIDASSVWDAGNNAPGVMINGGGGSFAGLYVDDAASSCQIYGLYITNFGGDGIVVYSASNWIGGSGAGQRNVLSGNDTGITLYGSSAQNNVLHNNYIGLTPAGNTKNPNDTGVYIGNGAVDNIIGGNVAGHVNYIAGNTYDGVLIEGAGTDNNWLGGNAIGLGTDLSNLGNGAWGIRIRDWAANTVIGGASGSGNTISYSAYSGIYAQNASGTQITDNLISGNGSDGVDIADSTACVVSNNLIGGNALNGVRVEGASAAGNLIWPNSIFSNGAKGIYLQNGGNMGIAAPVVTTASQWGASGTTCASCRVALYSDASDEGQVYHDILWADASGNWAYVGGPLVGPNLTATSIDGSGNTSEFSAPYTLGSQHKILLPLVCRNN